MPSEDYLSAQASAYQNQPGKGSLVLSVQTNFDAMGRAAAEAGRIGPIKMNARFRYMQAQIQDQAVEIMRSHTPYLTGELQESTVGESTQVGDFYAISIYQPAMNVQGTAEYAPFVILGHATRGGGEVTANPYPEEALPEILELVNAQAYNVMQQVSYDMIEVMSATTPEMLG